MSHYDHPSSTKQYATLKRTIGIPLLTLYGLGTILGAGIYVLAGKVAVHAGLYAPIAFLIAALLAGLSGYSYAVLSSHYPKSAGEAVYIQQAFGRPRLSAIVGWMVVLTGIVSAATIANGFVGYLQVFFNISDFWAISLLLAAMTALAIWGVTESVVATAITTILGIIGLLLILLYSTPALLTLPKHLPELVPPVSDSSVWFGILLGAFLAFYAFIGFEDMVNMAEEVKEPEKTLPKAIIFAIGISSLFYFLIALSAVLQLPLNQLIASKAPLADIMNQHSQKAAWFISLISLAAIVNGALVQIIMGARVLYGMGKQSLAPAWLSIVHQRRHTPYVATAIIGSVVWCLSISLELTALAKLTSFIILIVFLLVNLSLIHLIKTNRIDSNKKTKIQPWIPYTGVLMTAVFLAIQTYQIIFGTFIASH